MTATGALPAPTPTRRPRVAVVGTAFAAGASVMFVMGLIGIYLLRRADVVSGGAKWLPEDVHIPLTQSNVMFFTLVSAAIVMQWAAYAAKRDDRPNLILSLGLSLVLGAAFINMETYLFELMGFDIAKHKPAVLIYAILGGQLAMLIASMIFSAVGLIRVVAGGKTIKCKDAISSAALFWHATTAVYFIIWIAILITK